MLRLFTLSLTVLSGLALVETARAQTLAEALPDTPAAAPVSPTTSEQPPLVQLAILLDNSGSMSGLIEQAKSELWRVVNELTTARQNGRQPRLQVALYLYGDPPAQQLNALTDDLDRVSESLFAVAISGGSEYCGEVIQTATRELGWSNDRNDLKLIFIAGNEPFSQGPVNYRSACQEAIAKGIMVNTIHCGNGIPEGWREGALLADGKAVSINQNTQVVHIDAPQDRAIARLGAELNNTYIPFGSAGASSQERQAAQDSNASKLSLGSSVQRAISKANAYYRNSAWDLVDAINEGAVELAKIKKEHLPENMQKMSSSQRNQFVKQQGEARQRLQEQINQLSTERKQFVAEKRKEMNETSGQKTLDQALAETIRSQAATKNFTLDADK